MTWLCCAALKWRGRNWMTAAPADTASPASPASSPAASSRRIPRRLPWLLRRRRDARVPPPAPGDQPKAPVEEGPGCAPARGGGHGGTAGGLPDSGPLSPSSSRIVTTESYGLPARFWPTGAGLGPVPEATARAGCSSVRRQRGVDLADPREHASAHVDRVGETSVLHHGEGLSGPLP